MLPTWSRPSFISAIRCGPIYADRLKVRVLSYFFNNLIPPIMPILHFLSYHFPHQYASSSGLSSELFLFYSLIPRPSRHYHSFHTTSRPPSTRATVVCYCVISMTSHHLVTEIKQSRMAFELATILELQMCSRSTDIVIHIPLHTMTNFNWNICVFFTRPNITRPVQKVSDLGWEKYV